MSAIMFYEKTAPFYEFSNFYTDPKSTISIQGKTWINVEQYFQAMKFYVPDSPEHMEYFNIIQSSDSPMKCMTLGRQKVRGGYAGKWLVNKITDKRTLNEVIEKYKTLEIREDWNSFRDGVMYDALVAKFTQNQKLKKTLADTGDIDIIEASPRDSYWGWGKDKTGQNQLGKLLMKVRSELS